MSKKMYEDDLCFNYFQYVNAIRYSVQNCIISYFYQKITNLENIVN